jgi:prepilin-type N-terminal cleavage/methylation domain-containing protein
MKNQASGFTLIEVVVVVSCLGLGFALLAGSLFKGSTRKADSQAVKSMLSLASRRSLNEARHICMHYDSVSAMVGTFEDSNEDDIFNGVDTLRSQYKLRQGSTISILDSDSAKGLDICFRKNGATSSELSYELTLVSAAKDTTRLRVIAASGITQGGL